MKIAISTQDADLDSLVDPRFGRAAWFIITDAEGGAWEAVDNTDNADASGGAGVQAGTLIADLGVDTVITGNVGPNAHRVLAAAGVRVFQAGNGVTAREALERLMRHDLAPVDTPTVAGHWA
jgi:predicted Fe-Mo cluster-binding NifX family protein